MQGPLENKAAGERDRDQVNWNVTRAHASYSDQEIRIFSMNGARLCGAAPVSCEARWKVCCARESIRAAAVCHHFDLRRRVPRKESRRLRARGPLPRTRQLREQTRKAGADKN